MNYNEILNECEDQVVRDAVADAIAQLFGNCMRQLRIDVAERTIAGRLADFLRPHFAGLDVEIEYNRMGEAPKSLNWNENLELVYPDIIVHQPMTDEHNRLVIELKKSSNQQSKVNDLKKLAAFRREFDYQHALFLRFGVRGLAGTITECEWA